MWDWMLHFHVFLLLFYFSLLVLPGAWECSSNCKWCPLPTSSNFISAFLVGRKTTQTKAGVNLALFKCLTQWLLQDGLHLQLQWSLHKNSSSHWRNHQHHHWGCADLCPFCWALLPYFLTPSGSFLIQAARLSSALQPSCLHLPYQSYWSTEQLLGSLGITWRGSASSHGNGYLAESLPPVERLLVMQLEAVQLEVVQL